MCYHGGRAGPRNLHDVFIFWAVIYNTCEVVNMQKWEILASMTKITNRNSRTTHKYCRFLSLSHFTQYVVIKGVGTMKFSRHVVYFWTLLDKTCEVVNMWSREIQASMTRITNRGCRTITGKGGGPLNWYDMFFTFRALIYDTHEGIN